jgi:hypothetical protein
VTREGTRTIGFGIVVIVSEVGVCCIVYSSHLVRSYNFVRRFIVLLKQNRKKKVERKQNYFSGVNEPVAGLADGWRVEETIAQRIIMCHNLQ